MQEIRLLLSKKTIKNIHFCREKPLPLHRQTKKHKTYIQVLDNPFDRNRAPRTKALTNDNPNVLHFIIDKNYDYVSFDQHYIDCITCVERISHKNEDKSIWEDGDSVCIKGNKGDAQEYHFMHRIA